MLNELRGERFEARVRVETLAGQLFRDTRNAEGIVEPSVDFPAAGHFANGRSGTAGAAKVNAVA
jgi:hypothetical protein